MTQVFSVLSNEVRLRCLYLLAKNKEICVCEMVDALQISQPSASKALASLKTAGLLSDRRDANWVYYKLRGDLPSWLGVVVDDSVDEFSREIACRAVEMRFRRLGALPTELACS